MTLRLPSVHRIRPSCATISAVFFADKIGKIAITVNSRLFSIPAYHRRPTDRQIPCPLDELSDVTVDEVTKLIRSMPAKSSPVDFIPTAMLKSTHHQTGEHVLQCRCVPGIAEARSSHSLAEEARF